MAMLMMKTNTIIAIDHSAKIKPTVYDHNRSTSISFINKKTQGVDDKEMKSKNV